MAIDLHQIITEELRGFKGMKDTSIKPIQDPLEKRGPRHRKPDAGLFLDRKHQNIIANVHKANPNENRELERLRGLTMGGNGFVTFQEGDLLKQKYGLQTDDGYLGTTGIRLIRTDRGYNLVKEAVVKNADGEKFVLNNPDDVFESPVAGTTFSLWDGIFLYGTWYHYELFEEFFKPGMGKLKFYPSRPDKKWAMQLRTAWEQYYAKWKQTATPDDIQDWGNYGNPRAFFDISGRSADPSTVPQMVAFWNPASSVNSFAQQLIPFLKDVCGLVNPIMVTPDNRKGFAIGDTSTRPNIQNTIDQELMKKQHLVGGLKHAIMGGDKRTTRAAVGALRQGHVAQKAGYRSSAEYNASNIIGDSMKPQGGRIT